MGICPVYAQRGRAVPARWEGFSLLRMPRSTRAACCGHGSSPLCSIPTHLPMLLCSRVPIRCQHEGAHAACLPACMQHYLYAGAPRT